MEVIRREQLTRFKPLVVQALGWLRWLLAGAALPDAAAHTDVHVTGVSGSTVVRQ
jgi:hypothetical protein